MSTHRQIQTKIWCDKDVLSSSTNGKLLFLYLICNKHINNSGVYEIPLSTIAHDLKLPAATIKKLLKTGLKNIHYDFKNEMVFVTNSYRKYHPGGNPSLVKKGILNEYNQTKKTPLWSLFLEANPYFEDIFPAVGKGLPIGSLDSPEEPTPTSKCKFEDEIVAVINYLNDKASKEFKLSEGNKVNIRARLDEGYIVSDCFLVIDNKVAQWKGNVKMDEFLRPTTLFQKTKFDGYRNSLPQQEQPKKTTGSRKREQIERLLGKGISAPEPIRLLEKKA